MKKNKVFTFMLFVSFVFALTCKKTIADVKGDINDDNKIDLIEAIYALKVITQSTGNGFSHDLIDDRDFYTIKDNSTGGETCIIEFSYDGANEQVTAQEWLYINDNYWASGCQEEYVPNEIGTFPYTIVDGKIEIDFGEEAWPTELVQISNDNYLVSNPDGLETWYFSRDNVNLQVSNPDGLETWYFSRDNVNLLLESDIEFTQGLLSANSWYPVETNLLFPGDMNCNGIFTFDGIITVSATFIEDGSTMNGSTAYLLHEGKLSSFHDSKIETENLVEITEDYIISSKTALYADGSTGTPGRRTYFKNKQYAKAYMAAGEVTLCFEDVDETGINDFIGSWSGNGVLVAGDEENSSEIAMTLTEDGDLLNGSLVIDAGQPVTISGAMVNGIFTFDVPLPVENEGNPDCADWDLHAAATLNSNFQSMNLIFNGDVCGSGGSQPGILQSIVIKQ